MALGLYHFQLLHQVLERIHYIYNENDLARTVLEQISQALNSEAGSLFKNDADGKLVPLASYGVSIETLRSIPFVAGRGVIGWVIQHGQPVKVDLPAQDPRFVGSTDAITGFKTRNILAAPIIVKGNIIGVIEFLNKKNGAFNIPDLELVSMIGREVGIAFENSRLIHDISQTKALLTAMTNSLSAGILTFDLEGRVLHANPSSLRILGIAGNAEGLEKKPISTLLESVSDFLAIAEGIKASLQPVSRAEVKLYIKGQQRVIGYSANPIKNASNAIFAVTLLFQDITDYVAQKKS